MGEDQSLHYRAIFLVEPCNPVRDRRFILMSNSLSVLPCSRVSDPAHSSSHRAYRGHDRSCASYKSDENLEHCRSTIAAITSPKVIPLASKTSSFLVKFSGFKTLLIKRSVQSMVEYAHVTGG
jgi:hypothetical protein